MLALSWNDAVVLLWRCGLTGVMEVNLYEGLRLGVKIYLGTERGLTTV